jgi:SAM-dependent methyltransferase
LFLTDKKYVQNQRVVDLGCHTGFLSYICQHLGAKSTSGVNVRQEPLDIGQYAFEQLKQKNFDFHLGDIEDKEFLLKTCANKDTVVLAGVCEYLKNPYAMFETLTNSDVKHLIFETNCLDVPDAIVRYNYQSTKSNFVGYNKEVKLNISAQISARWIEIILYYFGWKIEYYDIATNFNKDWFAVPNLTEFTPRVAKTLTVLATKFNDASDKMFYE